MQEHVNFVKCLKNSVESKIPFLSNSTSKVATGETGLITTTVLRHLMPSFKCGGRYVILIFFPW